MRALLALRMMWPTETKHLLLFRNPKTQMPHLNASIVGQETLSFQSPNVLFPSFNA